jgi:hypothetical protein
MTGETPEAGAKPDAKASTELALALAEAVAAHYRRRVGHAGATGEALNALALTAAHVIGDLDSPLGQVYFEACLLTQIKGRLRARLGLADPPGAHAGEPEAEG